ncbi:unnamed protein product [Oikopleura dioica]|nr:unnamed protein product [Oikopleura dioica]
MVPKPAFSPRPASFSYDVNKLTRDLTIDDFSDMDLSEITRDDYTSSMESLVSIRSNKPVGLLPQRRAPLSRSQSLRDAKQAPSKKCLSLSDNYDRPADSRARPTEDKKSASKASFKELCGWGVFRPLEVDAAVLKGKV